MIERKLFTPDHEAFRDSFRRFVEREIAPHHEAWEEQGYVDRGVWTQAGANGFLCMSLPQAYGGSDADKLYSVIQMEELSRAGTSGIGYGLRQPFIGVHPETGLVTASDQQGHYVPSTPLHIIGGHRFYGHLPTIAEKEKSMKNLPAPEYCRKAP